MAEIPIPEPPFLVGDVTNSSLAIAWNVDGDVSEIINYSVYYTNANTNDESSWAGIKTENEIQEIRLKDLKPDTAYQFRVSSNTKGGSSTPSELSDIFKTKKEFKTRPNGPTPQKPYALGHPTHDSVPLAWTVNEETSNVTHYTVTYRAVNKDAGLDFASAGPWQTYDTTTAECNCIITGLYPNTSYSFSVSSNTSKGKSPPSPISDPISTGQESAAAIQNPNPLFSPPKLQLGMHNHGNTAYNIQSQRTHSQSYLTGQNRSSQYPNKSTDVVATNLTTNRQSISAPQKPVPRGLPGYDSITMQWEDSNAYVTHYTIMYRKYRETMSTKVDTNSPHKYYTIVDLDPSSNYQFCVLAHTNQGQSQRSRWSEVVQTLNLAPPTPNKPTIYNTDAVGHNSIRLAWHVPGDKTLVTNYTVSCNKVGEKTWMIYETADAATSFTVHNLEPAKGYRFYVQSNIKNIQGPHSEMSNPIFTQEKPQQTNLDQTPPTPNKPTSISVGDRWVTLGWLVTGCTDQITNYTLTYKNEKQNATFMITTDDADTNFTIYDLEPETPYLFQVASNNKKGRSPPSEMSELIWTHKMSKVNTPTMDLTSEPPKPNKPKVLGTPGHTSVLLCWKVPGKTTHVTNYTLSYRKADEKGRWLTVETETTDNSYTIEELEPETSYRFRVASNTDHEQSPPSVVSDVIKTAKEPDSATDQMPPTPNKPEIVGTPGYDSIPLRWKVPGNTTHVTHYTLSYRKADAKGRWMTVETETIDNSFTIEELEPETSYRFRVASNTDHGQSPPSVVSDVIKTAKEPDSATDQMPPKPNKPEVEGTPGHTSIPLRWKVLGNTTNVTHYTLSYRKADAKGRWMTVETETTDNSFTIEELEPETSYRFRVASNTGQGQSPPSEVSDVITTAKEPDSATDHDQKPPKPNKPEVEGTPGHTSIPLCWKVLGNTTHVTHYNMTYKTVGAKSRWITIETENSDCAYTVEELEPETSYQFRVASNTEQGQSPPSDVSDAIKTSKEPDSATDQKPPKPNTPEVVGTPGHTSIPLCWKLSGNTTHVTNFTITYKTVGAKSRWITIETENSDCAYTVEELEPETSYQFRVASNTEQGQSPPSDVSDVIKTSKEPDSATDQKPPKPNTPEVVGTPGHTSIPLCWKVFGNTTHVTNFTITYKTVGAKSRWITIETENSDCSYTVEELEPETTYQFRVASNTEQGQSPPSDASDVIKTSKEPDSATDQKPPKPNTPEVVGTPGHTSIPLCWKVFGNTTHVTNFTITYKTVGAKSRWITIETENSDCAYTIEELEPETTYQFRVASNTEQGQSPPSDVSDVIKTSKEPDSATDQKPPKPSKPEVVGTPGHTSIPLCWKVPGNTTHVTNFTITYKTVGAKSRWITIETENSDCTYTVEDLEPATSFQFRVASNTDQKQSPPSEVSDAIKTAKEPADGATDQKPPTPNKPEVVGAPSHTSITLCWKVPGNTTHVTNYTLSYRKADAKDRWLTVETETTDNSFTIEELEPETSYQFRVASITDHGQSPPSVVSDVIRTVKEPVSATDQKPPRPNNLEVVGTPDYNSVSLSWTVPGKTTHVSHYTISYRKSDAKGGWMTLDTEDTDTSYTIEGLEPETSYQFRVASNTKDGRSSPSKVSKVIWTDNDPNIAALTPPKPKKPKVMGTPGFDDIPLCWKVPGDDRLIVNYTISYRKSDAKGEWMTVDTEDSDRHYIIEGLDPDTSYQFRVASNTKHGQSPLSEASDGILTRKANTPTPVVCIPQPTAPRVATGQKPTQHTIPLVWEAETVKFSITNFTLAYKDNECVDWTIIEIPNSKCEFVLKGLEPGHGYTFYILAHSQTTSSSPSENSGSIFTDTVTPGQIYRKDLQSKSKLIQSNKGMPLYQVPFIVTKKVEGERIQMLDVGVKEIISKPLKVILVVGATGAGKSTLINGFLNYVIGVEWKETCRFRLVEESATFESQHQSQTRVISIYTLYHHDTFEIPYTLKIIDTPGFGDTEGIGKDKQITESIRNLFSNPDYGIDHIDAIGFVAQSSLARLTPTQKYIFDSILSLFGNDIGDNIFLLITFSDSQAPPVLASTTEAKIPIKSHCKFNNSALFAKNDTQDNEFDQMFWKMGAMSFKKFFTELEKIDGKSLYLTKEVLEERQQLEVYVTGIQEDIHNGLTKLEQFKIEINVVKQHEADIEKNKNFNYTVEEHKMVQVDIEKGQHVTNCLTCNRTCHFPCAFADDNDKKKCFAMDKTGNCTICSKNCIWSMHRNVPYRIIVETIQITKTADELKKRYEKARGEKLNAEKLTEKLLEDFGNLELKVLYMTEEVKRSISRLAEIALRPNPLSTVQYLDILIRAERAEAKPGFQARIDQLETVKAQAITLSKMAAKGYDPFGNYRETLKLAKSERPSFEDIAADIRKKDPSSFGSGMLRRLRGLFH